MSVGAWGRDFFVSYTASDEAWARWIAVELECAGYTTVSQVLDFRPGQDFVHQMHQAMNRSARTIAVLSPAYFASRFGEAEWRAAFMADPSGEKGLLIPVRIQPCDPPGILATRVYVDLIGLGEHDARERLLAGVDRNPPRATSAHFPGWSSGIVGESAPMSARFPGPDRVGPGSERHYVLRSENIPGQVALTLCGIYIEVTPPTNNPVCGRCKQVYDSLPSN